MFERTNISTLFHRYFEISVWVSALVLLALMSPVETHYSLCPLKAAGFDFCPGCGLGHSISWLFHGDLKSSIYAHPLGIFAVIILGYRVISLISKLRE